MLLEIAVFNAEDAVVAVNIGANRIELCSNYEAGGITCSKEILYEIRRQVNIPIFPIIRPRAGNFCYNQSEFELMRQEVLLCKQLGYDGIVSGILNDDKTVDIVRTKELVGLANPLPVTFHRAFDEASNPFEAVEDIIKCGCKRILTSGQQKTAFEGKQLIKELIKKANDRIIIMPGGGVRSSNIVSLLEYTNASEFHSAAINPASGRLDVNECKLLQQALAKNSLNKKNNLTLK